MEKTKIMTKEHAQLSIKTQVWATVVAIAAAVVLPQMLHTIGAISGLGAALGETFLPMHLPIILVGFLAGPYAGVISGLLGPLASFALSGMPTGTMLPFMMIELAVYGLASGLLRRAQIPTLGKVLLVQIAGRLIRSVAILFAVYALGSEAIRVSIIWMSVKTGLPGLVLQWVLLPLLVLWVDKRRKNEQ